MPEQAPTPYTIREIIRDAFQVLIVLGTAYTMYLSTHNKEKIESVQEVQKQAVAVQEKQVAVQEKTVEEAVAVKQTLEAKAAEDIPKTKSTLLVNWTYLANEASATGLKVDRDKANEAKRLYDEFVQRHP